MSNGNVNNAFIQDVVNQAIERFKQEQANEEQAVKKRHYHDTFELLKNYRTLKKHIDIDAPLTESEKDLIKLAKRQVDVEAIIISKARTKKIMAFVDSVLATFDKMCAENGNEDLRQSEIIRGLYTSPAQVSVSKLAATLNVDDRTIYRDRKKAIHEISTLLYGIENIE